MNLLKELRELAELAGQMEHLAGIAQSLARKGELEALEDLTARRRRMACRCQALITRIAPALQRWEEQLGAMGEAEASECWALAGKVQRALANSLKADAHLRQVLGEQLQAAQTELNRIKHTAQAMRAYQEAGAPPRPRQP